MLTITDYFTKRLPRAPRSVTVVSRPYLIHCSHRSCRIH